MTSVNTVSYSQEYHCPHIAKSCIRFCFSLIESLPFPSSNIQAPFFHQHEFPSERPVQQGDIGNREKWVTNICYSFFKYFAHSTLKPHESYKTSSSGQWKWNRRAQKAPLESGWKTGKSQPSITRENRGTKWWYDRVNMAVQSVSQHTGQTSALVLWSSSVSGLQLAEWEKHSSTQHKCLITLLQMFSSNSSLVPYRHISGAHPPTTRSKGNTALKMTKNKLPVTEGEIIIFFFFFSKNSKILGALFHFIWCLVFDVNTSGKKKNN